VSTLRPWLWRFAVVAAIAAAVGASVQPSSFLWLAVLGGSAAVLYSLAVVAPLLRSPAGVYLRLLIGRVRNAVSGLATRNRDNLLAAP
jgi:hypothetical protein